MKPQIVSDPNILNGKPVISGTRISVELILDRFSSGMNEKEILKDYPHLTSEQIQTAVSFAKKLVKEKQHSKRDNSEVATFYTHEISR